MKLTHPHHPIERITVLDAQINPKSLPALHRQMNKTLMVQWINADLMNRHNNDIDKSIVFYDENYDFLYATRVDLSPELWDALTARTKVRYWSRGVR